MRLPKDLLSNLYKKPNIYLCETDKSKICKLETSETKGSFKFNGLSEISFEVARVYNDIISGETKVNPYYDKIEALRLIFIEDFGYLELQGPELVSDGIKESKACKAYSLEYTLAQKYLEDFYINTGEHGSVEVTVANGGDIVPVTLYNPSRPELSLLDLILEKDYGNWKIGHVDHSLRTLSRKFEIDRQSIYDFLMNEVCEKFNCYIVFNTIDNTINVYAESRTAKFIGDGSTKTFVISPPWGVDDVKTVSVGGYKTTQYEYDATTGALTFLADAPATGEIIEIVDAGLADWETDVFVSFDNLSQEININYDADSIKTVLTVTYGDDGDIREVNLGLPYLTDLSYYYTPEWMGQDLYDAYTKYLQKSNECQIEYAENAQKILELQNKISFAKNKLSLGYGIANHVNDKTVGIYYIVNGGSYPNYTYEEVTLPADYNANTVYYKLKGVNVTENKVLNLFSAVRKYFVATHNQVEPEIKDLATKSGTWEKLLEELTDSFAFVASDFATLKRSLTLGAPVVSATAAFRSFLDKIWIELGSIPLEQIYLESYKEIQAVNISAGFSVPGSEYYWYYYPITIIIDSLNKAINKRKKEIAPLEEDLIEYQKANAQIADSLLMVNNFTDGQLVRLSSFLREDELHLDDIVETSLDDIDGIFQVKQDAMESGRVELQKLCQPQLQFSMSMANIYALPEFEPIVGQFQLGNVIRVALRPDYIKNSRLLQVDINFDDFDDFSCEFGELTNLRTQSDIHADLLSQAINAGKSVAGNSSYWTKGADTATSTDLKIQQGLLDATTQIKAIDGTQSAYIDKYGIHLQKVDPDTGEIDPHQTWMVNNMILMSDDGFETSRAALGQVTVEGHEYYGLIAEIVLSGYIEGSKIVGGDIYSANYESGKRGTHLNLTEGDFDFAGGKIVYDSSDDTLTLRDVTIEWSSDNKPDMTVNDISGLDNYLKELDEIKNQLDGRAQTWYQDTDPSINWTTDEDKTLHAGDLWHYTGETAYVNGVKRLKNSEWVWQSVDGVYQWVAIEISDELFDVIDGKAQIFITTPTPPYNIGDLWVQGNSGDIMHCVKTKTASEYFDTNDWTKSSKYTDDSALTTFIAGDYADDLVTINGQIDKKAETWYQSSDPSSAWTTALKKKAHVGDLWFDIDVNKSYIYTYNSTDKTYKWLEADGVPDEVYDAIDGKSTIYTSLPSSQEVGDLLIPTKTFKCEYNGATHTFYEKKIYRCTTSSNTFVPVYWGDTVANEVYDLADSAKSIADNAKELGDKLVNGLGFQETEITGQYIISPVIAGGSLLIGDTSSTYAQITTGGVLICQNASIHGHITAQSLTLEDDAYISSEKVNGLSTVATSGSYDDLTDKPTIPESVEDLGFDLDVDTIIYKGDIAQETKTDDNGISYTQTTVPTSDGTITYDTYSAGDYIVFGRSKGKNEKGNNYVCISTEGLLTARNALIYGTVYATDGEFTGKITADSGKIGHWNVGTIPWLGYANSLYATAKDNTHQYVTFLRNEGVPSYIAFGVKRAEKNTSEKYTESSFSDIFYIKNDGSLVATSGTLSIWQFTKTLFATEDLQIQIYKQPDETWSFFNQTGTAHFGKLNVKGNTTIDTGNLTLHSGNFIVSNGTKNRLATTENYGQRLLYCYEAPSPMFGDVGEGQLDDLGKCYVFLDDIFAETIDTDCVYQVFLQPYGKGECYVTERTPSYFIVEGTESLSFGWEIKAIQKDYDTTRLEEFDIESEKV